ncbi:hypothetical protein, partial [Phenylobacterium deserti]|uniref:hypothetical protein n=1 Tax=Phenylobacterium deserti TaxID=1914756 RepID=UPI001403D71A
DSHIHGVFKRPHSVSVEIDLKAYRQNATACASLSIPTMSKTQPELRPHCLAPVVGGGGYLVAGLFTVNRLFRTFCDNFGSSDFGANIAAGRRGVAPKIRSDSIEVREDIHLEKESKRFSAPSKPSLAEPSRGAAT